jgi:hypothetical protein
VGHDPPPPLYGVYSVNTDDVFDAGVFTVVYYIQETFYDYDSIGSFVGDDVKRRPYRSFDNTYNYVIRNTGKSRGN